MAATKNYQIPNHEVNDSMDKVRQHVNTVLAQMSQDIAALRGDGGREIHLLGPLNLHGQGIRNVGPSRDANDVAPRSELQQIGLYPTNNEHKTSRKIVMNKGARIPSHGSGTSSLGNDEVVTAGDVYQILVANGLV